MLAVYVDESVDKQELQQIVAAAERLGGPVESAPNLLQMVPRGLGARMSGQSDVPNRSDITGGEGLTLTDATPHPTKEQLKLC